MAIKYFDTLDFVKKSHALGASEDLSEFQVRQIEQAIESAIKDVKEEVKLKDIASKSDVTETELRLQKEIEIVRKEIKEVELNLQKEIKTVELSLQKEIKEVELSLQKEIKEVAIALANSKIQTLVWIGINTAFMLSIIAKGFHWW